MKITLHSIKVRELVDGYVDNDEAGVVGFGGKLDIRPPYQREFVYSDAQQQAVMDTVTRGFPLNTMYWVCRGDGRFEVLDGQQRTISICRYVNGIYSHNLRYFTNLQPDEKNSVVKTLRNLALTENLQTVDGSYVYASQVKILAAIDSQQLDVVLMNREAFDAFSQNGLLADLDHFSEEHDLTHLAPYFVDNIEILSDNATEVLTDPTAVYHAETDTYPMGIDVTEFPFMQQAGFPDHVYLGIIENTTRAENAAAFVSYLAG